METPERVYLAPTFASLPEPRSRWGSLSVSSIVQAGLLVAIVKLPFSLAAPVFQPPDVRNSVHLVAPEPIQPVSTPQPIVEKKPVLVPKPAIAPKLEVRMPAVKPPEIKPPEPEKGAEEVAKVTLPTLPTPKVPRPVAPTSFSGSSAPVTENKPARKVQTGGFGDPNGVPVNSNSTGNGPKIARLGSFDLPEGPGLGNGTGGAKGVRGTVASAGFGNGIATQGQPDPGSNGGQKKVQATNFGAVEPGPVSPPRRQTSSAAPQDSPVELLNKPTPLYTPEARQRKIEGDVELDVEFMATGKVHVLRVLRGLGYGLDDAAVTAAEQIHFNPARHDGQPVDSRGRLRIVFRVS